MEQTYLAVNGWNLGYKTSLPYRRIVAKFSTSLLTGGSDYLSQDTMSRLVSQVAQLHKQGLELLIVSCGAIASGRYKLGLSKELKEDIPGGQGKAH